MNLKPNLQCLLFLCGMVAYLAMGMGCASKEEKEARHYAKALEYIENKELKKAVIELKNVVQLNPQNDTAYYTLGETHLKLKQGRESLEALSQATTINPDNLEAQLKTGQIMLLGQKTKTAREKAEYILKKAPDHINALVLLSGVQAQERNVDDAIQTLQKAAALDPQNANIHLSLGHFSLLQKDIPSAISEYEAAKQLAPEAAAAYKGLSRIFAAQGNYKRAEAELQEMLKKSGSGIQNLHALARFYEFQKDWNRAEDAYLQMVDTAEDDDVTPLVHLANYYDERHMPKKALAAMQKAAEKRKQDLNIQVGIAQIHLEADQIKKAEAVLDKVLAKDNGHVKANFLKARIFLIKKEYNKALPFFDLTIRENPQHVMAHYFKALCHLGEKNTALTKKSLLQAVELNPRFEEPRLILGEIFLREGSVAQARQHIRAVLDQSSDNSSALMLLGIMKTMEQDLQEAVAAFDQVIAIKPDYAAAYFRRGMAYRLMGERPGDVFENLEKALHLDPKNRAALTFAVNMCLQDGDYDQAVRICREVKDRLKSGTADSAMVVYLEGRIAEAKGEKKNAMQHFEDAIALDPNILAPHMALAILHVQDKNIPGAIREYESLIKKDSSSLAGYMGLGIIYDQQGERKKAESLYRKALAIQSDFAPAANNLACALLENGGNIDEALGFAQIAKERMPANASIMDTLGWIYFQKGSYLNAIQELQDGLLHEPNNPVIHYHLGMAFFKNDQPGDAIWHLEKALKISTTFKGADHAAGMLARIKENHG